MSKTTNQKWGKSVIRTAIGTLFVFILICDTAIALPLYEIIQVTNNNINDLAPKISGNNVVWQSYDGYSRCLYFWNGSSVTQVTDPQLFSMYPQISGDNLVWHYNDGSDDEIIFWGNSGSNIIEVTDNSYDDQYPRISGNNVVWQQDDASDYEIFFWNGSSITQLTDNSIDDTGALISGNNVVWGRVVADSDDELFFWDGNSITQVPGTYYYGYSISGDHVVWSGYDGSSYEIFFWDGNSVIQITDNNSPDLHPQISGNNVVWESQPDGYGTQYEIFFWNGDSITQVTDNSYDDREPKISGNNVVWRGSDGSDNEIFFWDGGSIIQITDNNGDDSYPEISGNNVVWRGIGFDEGSDYEIFFARMVPFIGGRKWHDKNGNYVHDLDEQGLGGWRIYADLNENGQFDLNEPNAITDSYGNYELILPKTSSSFVVAEEQKNCWQQTYPGGEGIHTVRTKPGVLIEGINFGNARPTEIHLSVWQQNEQQKVTSLDNTGYDWFGYSVSISGDYAIMGASRNDTGSAYIFANDELTCGQWSQAVKLNASDGAASDFFGESVNISGDYAIVGAPYDDDNGNNSGSAYIFYRNEGCPDNWGQRAKLTASDAAELDYFGKPVCTNGNYAVVGTPLDDDNGANSGSVYIFYRNEGGADNWGQQAKLTASDAAAGDSFGSSVSISGDHVIVGAWNNNNGQGAAYIFHRNEGGTNNWGQQTKLTASDGAANDRLGSSVSISSDYAVASANYDDDNGENSGSVYIFYRDKINPTNWNQRAKLTASDGAEFDYFGGSVSISDDTVLVGASADDDNGVNSGSVYIFGRDEGGPDNWGQTAKLTASDGAANDHFGASVCISNNYVIAGAYGDDDNGISSGAAYIFGKVLCPTADLTGDCSVTLKDLAITASQWLQGVQ